MVLIRKSCPFALNCHQVVTPNCLAVKLTSEIDFVYNPNDEVDKIKNFKAAVADNSGANQLSIGDYNFSMNMDLDYVGYAQDPHHASIEFLFGLQEDNVFIDVYRFLHPYDLSYTWKVHNTQQ